MSSGGAIPTMHSMYVEARETAVKDRESAVATREADLAEQVAKCDKKKEEQLAELRQLADHIDQAYVLCSSIGAGVHCCLFRGCPLVLQGCRCDII